MPRDRSAATLPLSFAQEGLWFLDQLEPDSPVYNIPMGLRLKGALNLSVLQRCLGEILRRHEALRTRFEAVEGRPVQVIQPGASLEVPFLDLNGLPEHEREAEAMRLCTEEAQRPFNLAQDLMLRSNLIRLGEREHILFLNVHHIASDGWSMGLLVRELGSLYQAFSEEKPSPLVELAVQYADFALWQRERLEGKVLEKQLIYWRKQLEGAPALLELPTDRPRPARQSYRGALMSWELPKPLTVGLKELSRREGATLFMTLMAAFQTLLYRYTSRDDILVGTGIAGRDRTEIEDLIGFFVNTLVLRGDMTGNPSFRAFLGRTRDVALGAYAHQDLPFDRLVKELHPERDMSHSPLFQVMLVLQNTPVETARFSGLEVSPIPIDSGTSKFDLTLFVSEHGGILVEYSTDLFEAETIRRTLGHYQTLLEGIVSNPEQRLSDLPLLTGKERQQLLVEWNQTASDYPRDKCIHQLFEAQVARTPEAVAVVFENEQLTYRELNQRANQLARHLQAHGVQSGAMVGICVERSLEMVIGLLGILKAGGAYVPLDPAYPKFRLGFMLEETKTPVLLTQERLRNFLPENHAQVVCLDSERVVLVEESVENPDGGATPESLAYVIYTSGSTGKPKGTCVPHRAVVRLVRNTNYVSLTAKDVFFQFAPISFDASTFEIWGCLLNGGRLAVAPPFTPSLEELGQWIQRYEVTTLWLTAALFQQMAENNLQSLRHVRQLLAGGETLPVSPVRKVVDNLKGCQLINGYGPTENTTFTCCYPVQDSSRLGRSVPIGRPIANTQVYVLDRQMQPVPVGVSGELYIGGDGLAQGYLNQPDMTAEKFVSNPFSGKPDARLYRSGDLVRWLPDGNLEFLERIDNQVKIRGFRIELGEIEAMLGQHEGVRESVVLAREDKAGDKRLVAYIVARERAKPGFSELCSFLKAKLPEYMIPSSFVLMETFPLAPNGKVDRRALPAPEGAQLDTGKQYVAPGTPIEKVLAGLWAGVLGVERVGANDNFFDLGGHSLLAIQLQARVENHFGRRAPLAALFQAPTVSEFARLLADAATPVEEMFLATPRSSPGRQPLFCFHFFDNAQCLAKYLMPKWQVCFIESPFDKELRLWHKHRHIGVSLEELVARCLPTLRQVQPHGPYHLTGFCFGGVLAFEAASQLTLLGERVAFLGLVDAYYAPGCKPKLMPWIRRWIYHARRISREGFTYLSTKVRTRLALERRRRSQLNALRSANRPPGDSETERMRLPQAEFLGRLLGSYRPQPYAGNGVLIRSVGDPSFEFDPGATNGWGEIIQGGLQVAELGCGHMDIAKEPYIGDVAKRLKHYLLETETGS